MTTKNIAVLIGSLRKESFNRQLALAAAKLAPASLKLNIVEISELSFFNQDLESTPPAAWTTFRDAIRASDGVLFFTPEYNRSIPGVLKNAVDVGSRPYGKSVFAGRAGAVVSVTPGAMGGFAANEHLRIALMGNGMNLMAQPEMYIGHATNLVDANHAITVDSTREYVTKFLNAFAAWVDRNPRPV